MKNNKKQNQKRIYRQQDIDDILFVIWWFSNTETRASCALVVLLQ